MTVVTLDTPATRDAQALLTQAEGLLKRIEDGTARAAITVVVTKSGEWYLSISNTTLGDEAYAISILQARLMNMHNERDDASG